MLERRQRARAHGCRIGRDCAPRCRYSDPPGLLDHGGCMLRQTRPQRSIGTTSKAFFGGCPQRQHVGRGQSSRNESINSPSPVARVGEATRLVAHKAAPDWIPAHRAWWRALPTYGPSRWRVCRRPWSASSPAPPWAHGAILAGMSSAPEVALLCRPAVILPAATLRQIACRKLSDFRRQRQQDHDYKT